MLPLINDQVALPRLGEFCYDWLLLKLSSALMSIARVEKHSFATEFVFQPCISRICTANISHDYGDVIFAQFSCIDISSDAYALSRTEEPRSRRYMVGYCCYFTAMLVSRFLMPTFLGDTIG
jgi:hypothetical protein